MRYTAEQIRFLRDGYQTMYLSGLTEAFNAEFGLSKTEAQIKSTLCNHAITCGLPRRTTKGQLHSWTDEQAAWLKEGYKTMTIAELTDAFKLEFGIEKTFSQIRCFTRNHKVTSGRSGCFEKGSEPANKGVKGWQAGGRSKETQFKKGTVPPNTKPLGHERICSKDGYILVKIAEPNPYTKAQTRYKAKHIVVWEKAHGPVPKGYKLSFKDGNKLNCDIENLDLLTHAEMLRLNKMHYAEAPQEIKPTLKVMAKLDVKRFELSREAGQ